MSGAVAIYALTAVGVDSARRLAPALGADARLFLPERLAQAEAGETAFARLAPALASNWAAFDGHVLFAAAGIVVRALTGLIQDKASDPAVVVCDPAGRYAVSLLAGHLGGANALARRVAAALEGQAVITTATDQAGLPSLELVALEAGLRVENLKALAGVSAALLDGRSVAIDDPEDWLTSRLTRDWPGRFSAAIPEANSGPSLGVDWRSRPPRDGELLLRPPALWLGLGCNRGTAAGEMDELVTRVLAEAGLSSLALAGLASASAKAEEAGLLALAQTRGLETRFYDAQSLDAVAVPNPSDQPRRHLGTRSVAEAAALIAAGPGGRLLVEKRKSGNVTLAVAWGRGR